MKNRLLAIALLICTVCTCSKQSPLKAYRYSPPPPPPAQDTTWTWTKLNWGGLEAWSVVVNPNNGNTVYVASYLDSGGVWKSTDGGGTFVKLWACGAFGGIALDPTNHGVLYAARAGYGVWRSRDGGATWNNIGAFYTCYVQPDRFDSSYIMAGHFRSTDYGASWSLVLNYIQDITEAQAVVQSYQNPNLLYATCVYMATRETYKSMDRGATWTVMLPGGGTYTGYYRMAIDPWNDQKVYGVLTHHGFYGLDSLIRTLDGGATWETYPIKQDTLWNHFLPVAVDPRPGLNNILYAAGQGVHRSTDNGKTWKTIGLDGMFIRDIAVDPTAPTNTTVLYIAAPCMGSPGNCDRVYKGTPGK
jgi:hypothetical protein